MSRDIETDLVERIKRGECEVKTLGGEGKIVGFVFEFPGALSQAAQANIREMGNKFIAEMGFSVPLMVLQEGMKILPVVESTS